MDATNTHSPLRRLVLVAALLLAVLSGVSLGLAYAEEHLTFRDPYTQELTDDEISSIHYDLTYAMALAAGFSITDSIELQIWNQLVDSEVLGPDDTVTYNNCLGSFPPDPPDGSVCPPGTDGSDVVWPMWGSMHDTQTCTTSRYGPFSPFFHFPRQNEQEIGALRAWGWGYTDFLVGYQAFAWDGATVLTAKCAYTRTVTIDTGITAGSLPAFATYLHSLGDSYSHRECQAALDSQGAPWGTHTLPVGGIPECTYNPANWQNDDAHGREFGTQWMADSLRTDEGILAIYAELAARSLQREGQYYPRGLDEPLAGMGDAATLHQALYNFVHNWAFQPPPPKDQSEFALKRREYAGQIAAAALAERQAQLRIYLPVVQDP